MLNLRVIRKYHDNKGLLYAYRVKDLNTGSEMDVHKDELKNAVARGAVSVDNMTLTSDGRLIGHATHKDRPVARANRAPVNSGRIAEAVFTNGRKIACIMVNETEHLQRCGLACRQYKGLNAGFTFDVGFEATKQIADGGYTNIKMVDGKPDFSNTKKKAYKQLKEKLLKILEGNGVHSTLTVGKGDNKYEYIVTIDNYDSIDGHNVMAQVIYILIENAMYDNNIKPLYIDEDKMFVSCMTGINDVRKALKIAEIAKF